MTKKQMDRKWENLETKLWQLRYRWEKIPAFRTAENKAKIKELSRQAGELFRKLEG